MPQPVERVLVSTTEYDRLKAIEKKFNLLSISREKPKRRETEDGAAAELEGRGAQSSVNQGHHGKSSMVPPNSLAVEGVESLASSYPVPLHLDVLPPPEIPNAIAATIPDNSDRIHAEAVRDKTIPSTLPLNDPLGASHPRLPEGQAPTKQFIATAEQRGQDSATSLGTVATKAQGEAYAKWYFLGLDFSSGSDNSDDSDMDT